MAVLATGGHLLTAVNSAGCSHTTNAKFSATAEPAPTQHQHQHWLHLPMWQTSICTLLTTLAAAVTAALLQQDRHQQWQQHWLQHWLQMPRFYLTTSTQYRGKDDSHQPVISWRQQHHEPVASTTSRCIYNSVHYGASGKACCMFQGMLNAVEYKISTCMS